VLLGRAARLAARLRGGGTALPGLLVERLNPRFVAQALAPLPFGVAVISGTNGKTTTTKLVVELLRGQGLEVFTNPSGSNFSRGVASALLGRVDAWGRLDADIAVLELDEAHGVQFVADVPPRYCLLLNVLRDQLDRFGEIDSTTRMLQAMALRTTEGVVLNRDDPRVAAIARSLRGSRVRYFGVDPSLRDRFPGDDALHGRQDDEPPSDLPADVVLAGMAENRATFEMDGRLHTLDLRLRGSYNLQNAAAGAALVRAILGEKVDERALLRTMSEVAPAFGRGETIDVQGASVELVLVKNPAGFRSALESFDPSRCATVIAINDHDNDSRDVSWLWDVEFDRLEEHGVAMVTGIRAAEMNLRLQYDDIRAERVEADLDRALDQVLRGSGGRPVRIFCTYTAMLQLRRRLAQLTPLAGIDG
jgi:UDP-N-acetylmuramyl tripeptide synthase